uniref:Uncharacterized protein n=1 Tax=Peronospora matthiolae TaxID=2874970 RepID=A0AAV1VIG1_9STRA
MRRHPTFYIGRLLPYYQYEPVSRGENTSAVESRDHLRVFPFPRAILVDYRRDLFTQFSDVSTSYSHLITKRTSRTFVLKLRERKRGTAVRTIVR